MDIQQGELSLKFYSFLCDIIGTKQVVNKRRHIFSIREDRNKVYGLLTVSSGSKAEGLDLNGSDYDEMIIVNFAQVFEHLDHVKCSDEKLPLIMDTENVKPGFTKLCLQKTLFNVRVSDLKDRRAGRSYLSCTVFRQVFCDSLKVKESARYYIHGPCSSDGEIDCAVSLHCTDWISQALPWVSRTKYSWASDEVIRNILCSGVLFVPIGSKNSPFTDLEWRISFSYAEKQLIHCFNHVQLFCYALLKIILKDIIQKKFGDLLCSYFMKTIMFWLCEETDVTFWKKENMFLCFMTCLRRLIYCVENETCLHYFIPENNLFENRFETQHSNLLSQLHGLCDLGWTCLLQTETLQSFNGYLEPSFLSNISLSTFFPSFVYLDVIWVTTGIRYYDTSIERCIRQSMQSKKKKDLYVYFIADLYQSFAQQMCDEKSSQSNNKVLYRNLRRQLSNLIIGLNHDAVSGWLLLASFFLSNKQYHISKILIDHSFSKLTTERCELFGKNNLWQLKHYVELQNMIGLRCLKNYTISQVRIHKHSSIIPDELKSLFENKKCLVVIPSIVYAHAMSFLFHHTVGDKREKETSYHNLMFHAERYNMRNLARIGGMA